MRQVRRKKKTQGNRKQGAKTSKGFRSYLKAFFFKKGKFNPLRYLITLFSHLCAITVLCRLVGCDHISDEFVGIMVGLVPLLIGADVWRQNRRDEYQNQYDNEPEGQP